MRSASRSLGLACALVLCASLASAEEPSRVCGRVLERGSAVEVTGASVSVGEAAPVLVDADARFCIDVPGGPAQLTVIADGYTPLHLEENVPPGVRRSVEYRLLPLAGHPRFRSVVRGNPTHEGERFTLRDEELHQAPGTGGDPFRVVALLPGVIQPIPILPIYVVRGGSPGMNGFFIDGMRVPQLFHLVVAEGVVHPRVVDQLEFYSGGYDASFGRIASGVVNATTRPGRSDAPFHGDVELKLYDASALFEVKIPHGVTLLAAGRYGYPGLLIGAFAPGVSVNYWDYQLRLDWHGLTVQALGSYDSLRIEADPATRGGFAAQLLIEFHRLQIRERIRRGRVEVEAALVGGLDRMSVFSGQGVQKLFLNARVSTRVRLRAVTITAGADVEASRFTAEAFVTDENRAAPDALGDLAGDRTGVVGGGYAQATLSLDRWLHRPFSITAGVRADVYHAGNVTLLGVDPRLIARFHPIPLVEIFGALGQYTQAPSFPVPLPGIDTFALQLGLQRSIQGSLGVRFTLPHDLSLSATGYYGRFTNINDVVLDFEAVACTSPPPESLRGVVAFATRQIDGAGYGMELLLRRKSGRVTGWLAYTLSRSERIFSCGLGPADFDQSHVLNAVVQVRLPWRLMLGFRLAVSSGRPYTLLSADLSTGTISGSRNNERLPTYVQLDLRLDREWIYKRWALALFVDILNITYSQTVFSVTYPKDPVLMTTRYDQPQFEGFRFILPSLGLRARF